MINLDQIEEWIHEVEERPSSAAIIIRYIAGRLKDLSERNEELLAENIQLQTGQKIEEYENRVANLEYQLDILRRQMSGQGTLSPSVTAVEMLNILIYNIKGQVLRLEVPVNSIKPDHHLPGFSGSADSRGPTRITATTAAEELLCVFDSGRTETFPVTQIPVVDEDTLDWKQSYLVEPRGGEELIYILPIARMSLFEYCVQVSRRGCAKKMMKSSFESAVAKTFVGAGIKNKPDKTCTLSLGNKEDTIILASREGFVNALEISQLPYTIEEVMKLSATDYLASCFVIGNKNSVIVVTEQGKIIHRESSWAEKPASFKSKGQAIFSQSRRDAGVRVAAAAAVDDSDWGLVLPVKGPLTLHKISDLLSAGSLPNEEITVLDFAAFNAAGL